MTHPSRRWPGLDGLRGVAIIVVVVYHLGIAPFDRGGFLGVELFFVLSGFLITSLLVGEWVTTSDISLRRFYGRRVLRLYPAQLVLALTVLALALTFASSRSRGDLLAGVPGSLLYVSNWVKAFELWGQGALTHTWSLSIEEQYYLLWPPLALLALRHRGVRGLLGVAIVAVLATTAVRTGLWWSGASLARLYSGTDTRAPALLLGSLAGVLLVARPRLSLRPVQVVALPCLLAFLVACVVVVESRNSIGVGLTLLDCLLVVLVVGAATSAPGSVVLRLLEQRHLVLVGTVSYGLYLWHKAVIVLVNGERLGLARWQEVLVETVAFSTLTVLSWRLVEQPLQRRFRARLDVRRGRLDGASTAGPPTGVPAPRGSHDEHAV